ncbi:MAG: hypothetical protein R3F41_12865 [Gammaproteobacteria bacterium]|nr:hypothetical protein [Pseudomonadales bacterium]MCP5348989.1 hypothetical protein [Pseudomonadales bacterium]
MKPKRRRGFYRVIHGRIALVLKLVLLIGALLLLVQGRYQASFEVLAILFVTWLPTLLGSHFKVVIPYEFESLAVVFVYMALFLGEVRGFYTRFWWWDVILHTGSGFLLGIFGFLLVYVLNEKEDIDLHLQPKFVALFAFMFAMGVGALWEIFEFAMDQSFGLTMQKSGLVDTMWDLIVDGIGAATIAILGWGFLRKNEGNSFLEKWINKFISNNPRLFDK